MAGVYAVAALADDWPAGRQMCIDVLCAYLRMPYIPPPADEPEFALQELTVSPLLLDRLRFWQRPAITAPAAVPASEVTDKPTHDPHEERQVRHTVIRVIAEHLRLPADHPRTWQSLDLDFTGATFDGGDFSGATFSGGTVDFVSATFSGGTVNFHHATFTRHLDV